MGVVESQLLVHVCNVCPCCERLCKLRYGERADQFTKFQSSALRAHNLFRAKHGVPPLSLCGKLCLMANSHAKFLVDSEFFEHSDRSSRRYRSGFAGENLAESEINADEYAICDGFDVTNTWYKEGKNYNYSREPNNNKSYRFTQLIWLKTKFMGISYADSGVNDGVIRTVVVANYYPCGNITGEFLNNVLPIYKIPSEKSSEPSKHTFSKKKKQQVKF